MKQSRGLREAVNNMFMSDSSDFSIMIFDFCFYSLSHRIKFQKLYLTQKEILKVTKENQNDDREPVKSKTDGTGSRMNIGKREKSL